MNTNKAPNKIYLSKFPEEDGNNEYGIYEEWSLSPIGDAENTAYIRKDTLMNYFHQRIEELNSPLNGVFGSTERDNCNERISELLLLIDKLNEM